MKPKRKDLDKIVSSSIKEDLKKNKLKSRGGVYYKKIGQYFIYIHIGISGMQNDIVRVRGYMKPFIVDDIFWEVFDMQSNSNESIGLRANGAYKVDGFEAFYNDTEYGKIDNVENVSKKLLNECYENLVEIISNFKSFGDFLPFSKSANKNQLYDYDLVNMLLLIKAEKYKEVNDIATKLIEKHEYGRFSNEGKYIYEYIVDYCNKHIG